MRHRINPCNYSLEPVCTDAGTLTLAPHPPFMSTLTQLRPPLIHILVYRFIDACTSPSQRSGSGVHPRLAVVGDGAREQRPRAVQLGHRYSTRAHMHNTNMHLNKQKYTLKQIYTPARRNTRAHTYTIIHVHT